MVRPPRALAARSSGVMQMMTDRVRREDAEGEGDDKDGKDGGHRAVSQAGMNRKKEVDKAFRRPRFTGYAPGFLPMTEPWTQTQFSMELPGSSTNPRTQGTCQL